MVPDSGSRTQFTRVDIQGVPADGIVDTATDITNVGGKLFALVVTTAKLCKKDFRKLDRFRGDKTEKRFIWTVARKWR